MVQLHGSWVAMPTPFTEDDRIDFKGFETLIEPSNKVWNFTNFYSWFSRRGNPAYIGREKSHCT